jgi:DNA primase
LSLQEDEVELANPLFDIFNDLINYFQNEGFSLEQYLILQPEFAQEVTDILMEDERLFCIIGKAKYFPKYKRTL